jgi:hypothetical protein
MFQFFFVFCCFRFQQFIQLGSEEICIFAGRRWLSKLPEVIEKNNISNLHKIYSLAKTFKVIKKN